MEPTLEKPLSISELTEKIKGSLERGFSDIYVSGEISNFKAHPSGHFYFSLKDEKANISAVIFRGENMRLKFKPHDGLKVLARGKISVYPPRGSYQVLISRMEPEGLGALQLAFEQLKKKLEAEGLFSKERKRQIPRLPRTIGIVTSPSGAAVQDMLNVLNRRFAGLHILIYPAKVQGEGAAQEVAAGIEAFNKFFPKVEALIVGRGGGSIEDLWAFNEEVVARAIYGSKIPIISAVGHEVDFTIADFVADLRAPTPSAAAELVISSKLEVWERVDYLVKRLLGIQSRLEIAFMNIDDLLQKMTFLLQRKVSQLIHDHQQLKAQLIARSPHMRVAEYRHRLYRRLDDLRKISKILFEKKLWHVQTLSSKLELLNPRTIMNRGYSIVRLADSKRVVTKASDVRMGDKLLIELSKGKITAKV